MKPAAPFALIAALLAGSATAVEYTVSTCADLADVDDTLATGLTIDSSTFHCDDYTRFRVRNTMTLKATVPAVQFSNFSLKVLGELTVNPDVTFTDIVEVVKNGGVLYVDEGAKATFFMGTSNFTDNSVFIKQLEPVPCGDGGGTCTTIGAGRSYKIKKGGAVHNKGVLTFEGDATFVRNFVHTDDSVEVGKGGAVSNIGSGSIWFKSKLTMEGNRADGFFESQGGGFYNRGDVVVDGESYFALNESSDGGAIFQTKIGSMTFNTMAIFYENTCFDLQGAAIMNSGGTMDFNGGSLFERNKASGSGDGGQGGAIYNRAGGVITLTGPTTFKENSAWLGGAIYNTNSDGNGPSKRVSDLPMAITLFPDDAMFIDNRADVCPDIYVRDVYDDDVVGRCAVI